MKNILPILLMVGCSIYAYAQEDTTTIETTETVDFFEKQTFLEEYNYVFGTQKPEKQLFKIDLLSWSGGASFFQGKAEYERKLISNISLNTSLNFYRDRWGGSRRFIYDKIKYTNFKIDIEPRWYYNMNKRIAENKSVDNLTGSYMGLRLGTGFVPNSTVSNSSVPTDEVTETLNQYTAELTYGFQGRLFKWGYLNVNIGAGANYREEVVGYDQGNLTLEPDLDFLLRYDVGIGIAIGNLKQEQQAPTCDFLKCYVQEKDMWKIDVFDLIKGINTDFKSYGGELNIGYERKIGESPFSINGELTAGYFSAGPFTDTLRYPNFTGSRSFTYGYRISPRWYYNMNKRIAKGKSGNNLSGSYVALDLSGTHQRSRLLSDDNTIFLTNNQTAAAVFGYQQRIFNNGFIDFNIGYGANRNIFNNPSPSYSPWEGVFTGQFRLGFAF